uniref:Uncharacterized protein n=1 Tax=Hubei lepidoptera virus 4 TaxID=1922906 RepID=A0A1L3KP51_9VIRU|nr:hypothetical protein 1 [Hubei lepidoptera virus 4]
MVVKLNYRGVLITGKQYRTIANDICNKNFIHFSIPTNPAETSIYLDQFWFRLGYSNSINIVVSNTSHDILTKLVHSGLLVDLRASDLPLSQGGVYDLFQELIYGSNTRVKLCNDIRTSLAKLGPHRWCGAELESLFHPMIYNNATEICGNNAPGEFFRVTGSLSGEKPVPMHEKHLSDLYQHIITTNGNDGQRKLGLIMCAIPIVGYNIIYVGGSPGTAWTDVLREREFKGKIISVDPSPMDADIVGDLEVDHYLKKINRSEDLEMIISQDRYACYDNYVLIWDVRHGNFSNMSVEERRDIIAEEVIILTSIMTSAWFREKVKMYQIKVNTSNIDLYSFPRDGKIYMQPYTLSREVYEVRCVGYVSRRGVFLQSLANSQIESLWRYLNAQVREIENGLSEYRIFLNFMTSMYRECDYIEEPPLIKTKWEIALFTLNWNHPEKIDRYFSRIYDSDVRFIGSFFTKDLLSPSEYEFDEQILIQRYASFVFDSRALIAAKVEGLYLFANTIDCRYMYNELIFSECYLIGATEYSLHSRNKMSEYDICRSEEAATRGLKFAKFPVAFSLADDIISPSGHSLRMFIEFVECRASLVMFIHKILSNFYSSGRNKLASDRVKEFVHDKDNDCWLSELSERFIIERINLERAESTVWHSLIEWIIGYRSALHLIKGAKSEIVEHIETFLSSTIKCDLKGTEIYQFRQKSLTSDKNPPLLPRHQVRGEIVDPYLIKVAKVYKKLRLVQIPDWARWLVTFKHKTNTNEWQWAVLSLGLDMSARDLFIHTAYIRTISNRYNAHDASKNTLLELILNAILINVPGAASWAAIPHYLANTHHPQHEFLKQRYPTALARLATMNAFEDVYTLLINIASECATISPQMDDAPFSNYEELAVDLIARRWQKIFPFERVVTRQQLSNVQEYAFRYKNVDMNTLHVAVESVLSNKEVYLKRDVEQTLASVQRDLFP